MSESAKYCFIINCASNAYSSEGLFRRHENLIRNKFPDSEIRYIHSEDSIQGYVNDNLNNFSHFIACGGDGTVNQVANSLADKDKIMGVIPLGSGNDFAKNIGLNADFGHNLSVLIKDKVKKIDAIQANQELFVNTYGIGVDGLTNYYASKSKFRSGFLKYFIAGLRALLQADRFDVEVTIDESSLVKLDSIWMFAVANGKTEGGRYKISPYSDNGDGVAEIVIVNDISRLRLIIEFIKLSFGVPFNQKVVDVLEFTRILKVHTSKELRAHSDGEQLGTHNRFSFQMEKACLSVIVK
ncbi:diacylglycerol/lipid kinase family protein [Gracilimonas sp. Q87]|uniref:diacylglycerol/lipid kinase family protein n=1 Tax=Gracilimonas sp. Q87 TaxID=3384766 RepID=UPI003983ED88